MNRVKIRRTSLLRVKLSALRVKVTKTSLTKVRPSSHHGKIGGNPPNGGLTPTKQGWGCGTSLTKARPLTSRVKVTRTSLSRVRPSAFVGEISVTLQFGARTPAIKGGVSRPAPVECQTEATLMC